jgi:hypothetical protein
VVKEADANAKGQEVQLAHVQGEEKRKNIQKEAELQQAVWWSCDKLPVVVTIVQNARYQDQLSRQRYQDQLQKQREMQEQQLAMQEQSIKRQEAVCVSSEHLWLSDGDDRRSARPWSIRSSSGAKPRSPRRALMYVAHQISLHVSLVS